MAREIICGIYCIENIVNGNKYIGQSKDCHKRWAKHKYEFKKGNHKNKHLQNSYDKYGLDSFSFYLLESCLFEELDDKEIFYIKELKTFNCETGYNMDGGGSKNKIISDETRKLISEKGIGRKCSEETKKKISDSRIGEKHWMKGKHLTDEHKKKMSDSTKGEKSFRFGKVNSEEIRKKIGDGNRGKIVSKESREKMSESRSGNGNYRYEKKDESATSRYLDICYIKRFNDWVARTSINGKRFYIGRFKDEIIAAKERDKYIVENNLPKRLNFPEDYPDFKH